MHALRASKLFYQIKPQVPLQVQDMTIDKILRKELGDFTSIVFVKALITGLEEAIGYTNFASFFLISLITVRSLILEGREELMPDWVRKNRRCSCYARVEDLIVLIPCNTWKRVR